MAVVGERKAFFHHEDQVISILSALHEQRQSCRFCDVILKVCGQEIYAHSNVLTAASPYFSSFLGHGQDLPRAFSQKAPQIIEIHIDGTGSDGDGGYGEAVRKVVDFMYTCSIELSNSILTQVVEIAKIMQMENILNFCGRFRKGETGNSKSAADVAVLANEAMQVMQTAVALGNDADDVAELVPVTPPPIQNPSKTTECQMDKSELTGVAEGEKECPNASSNEEQIEKLKPLQEVADEDDQDIGETDELALKFPELLSLAASITKAAEVAENEMKRKTRGRKPITSTLLRKSPKKPPGWKREHEVEVAKVARPESQPVAVGVRRSARRQSRAIEIFTDVKEEPEDNNNDDYDVGDEDEDEDAHETKYADKRGKVIYSCDQCDFKSEKLKIVTNHKREHKHALNICSYCEFEAGTSDVLAMHLSRHSGPRPYFCTACDLTFRTITQLNLHLPKHSTEKPFVCEICNAGFKWKHALKNHQIVHSGSKDHLCDICGFSTAHKSQLKAHKLIHTGETFKCMSPGCSFQATKRQNLKYHMLTHTQEKPHQCYVCGQSFSLAKNMKRHMLLHSEDRPFNCDLCQFTTTRYDKLKEHGLKQHGTGEPPSKKHRIKDYQTIDLKNENVQPENLADESSELLPEVEETTVMQCVTSASQTIIPLAIANNLMSVNSSQTIEYLVSSIGV